MSAGAVHHYVLLAAQKITIILPNTSGKSQVTTAQMKVMLRCAATAELLASGCWRGRRREGRWRNRVVVLAGEPVGRDRQVQIVLAGERIHVEVGAAVSRRQRHIDLAVLLEQQVCVPTQCRTAGQISLYGLLRVRALQNFCKAQLPDKYSDMAASELQRDCAARLCTPPSGGGPGPRYGVTTRPAPRTPSRSHLCLVIACCS
jgi:hypothetical protein